MNWKDNDIRKHVYSIPELVCNSIENCISSAMQNLSTLPKAYNIKHLIITGCGYSYSACMAVKDFLVEYADISVNVLPAIEFSRFSHMNTLQPKDTLFVGVSNSGAVSRILEAVTYAQAHEIKTVGITAKKNGELNHVCDYILDCSSESIGRALPLRGYAMTILNFLAIGHFIRIRKGMDTDIHAQSLVKQLCNSMHELEASLDRIDNDVYSYLEALSSPRFFEFIGSGYERASAFLGKIEMMGQAGTVSVDEDTEQWCHCNFFMNDPETIGTILFLAKNSPANSRGLEVMHYSRHLKRPICVVTDDISLHTSPGCKIIHVPQITACNAALIELSIPSLLTGYFCDRIDEEYSRGFREPWSMFKNGCGTCESRIELIDE